MKTPSTRRKLPVNKERLRHLAATELVHVRGGAYTDARTAEACTQTCFSCEVGTSMTT